jgi:hypothetical protein
MADQVSIRLRLHYPGHRVGDVIKMDAEKADKLVNAKYATYEDEQPAAVEYERVEPDEVVPAVDLPAEYAVKAEWVKVADNLGIETDTLTKAEIIEVVKDAVGG